MLTVNKDTTINDGVTRLLKEVETQFADCLIPLTSISKNKIIGKGSVIFYILHSLRHRTSNQNWHGHIADC